MSETLPPEQALRLIDTCPIPMVMLDSQGAIRACNPAFTSLFGQSGTLEQDKLLGDAAQVSWKASGTQLHHYAVHRSNTGGDDPLEVRYFIDITRQVMLEQSQQALRKELREQSLTDTATGLLNQRGVMLALEPQVARSRRYNSPISVVTLDVQWTGKDDALRKRVAQHLKDQLRWADLVGCDDTQCFLLVLPETAQESARRLAEKLRKRLLEFAQGEFPAQSLSVAYGVSGWQRTDNASTLLKRSALALQQARSGQDQQPVAL